jgi:hypothetical protein
MSNGAWPASGWQLVGVASPARRTWALVEAGAVALRHGGCYRYAFRLGRTRAGAAVSGRSTPAVQPAVQLTVL